MADKSDLTADAFRWIDQRIMRDPAYQALSERAKLTLISLGLMAPFGCDAPHEGFISWATGIAPDALGRGLRELLEAGFVQRKQDHEVVRWWLADRGDEWARTIPRPRIASPFKPVKHRNWWTIRAGYPEDAPEAPGVYVFILDGQIGYIGQSNNLRARLESHGVKIGYGDYSTKWGQFCDVRVKIRGSSYFGDWLMREARLIHRLRPVFNRRNPISLPADA